MTHPLSTQLAALSDDEVAARIQKHTRPLRGVRGVPLGKLAELVAERAAATPARLPEDGAALTELFGAAWEDGLAAIGLLAASVSDDPESALALGLDWADRTDDVTTADALGWLVLGPAAAACDGVGEVLEALGTHPRPETRRAAAAMALAFTPEEVEGPAAAGLRARHGSRALRMVDAPVEPVLSAIVRRFLRDTAPPVQKVLRRIVRSWVDADPAGAVAWARAVPGGLPKLLGAEIDRGRRG